MSTLLTKKQTVFFHSTRLLSKGICKFYFLFFSHLVKIKEDENTATQSKYVCVASRKHDFEHLSLLK